MKILYVSQYFPPEMGAPSARVSELAVRWVRAGHEVTVLTGFPNHPTGVIPIQYRSKWIQIEDYEGVKVVRTYLYATPNKGIVRRGVGFFSFALSALFWGQWFVGKCDVVVATSPQFLCALAGYGVSRVKRAPFVLEIRDLWPQSIVEVGLLKKESFIVRILEKLENFLYRKSDLLISVTDSFPHVWINKGINPKKIYVVKNGVDLSKFSDGDKENSVRKDFNLTGKFVISYIGTHGLAHGLSTLIQSAEILKDEDKLAFILVGEGADKASLKKMVYEKELKNVIFIDQVPREKIPDFIRASDLCAVLLKKSELFEKVIPSKIFEIMACSRPIILGVRGEAKSIIENAECGYPIEPENAKELSQVILKLIRAPKELNITGKNGRKYVERYFDRDKLAKNYADLIGTIIPQSLNFARWEG